MADHTNDTEHLGGHQAVEKMKELVNDANICHFVTNLHTVPLDSRPMATLKVDDDGSLWFFSAASSHKNQHIHSDPYVQLFYANKAGAEFLTVYGTAIELKDRQVIEDLWTPMAKAWFKDGKDDPDLTAIRVKPEYAYYWDTKSNKMVSLIKIAASVVTGSSSDDGIEGTLNPR